MHTIAQKVKSSRILTCTNTDVQEGQLFILSLFSMYTQTLAHSQQCNRCNSQSVAQGLRMQMASGVSPGVQRPVSLRLCCPKQQQKTPWQLSEIPEHLYLFPLGPCCLHGAHHPISPLSHSDSHASLLWKLPHKRTQKCFNGFLDSHSS
jgi:hypothetical protein